MEHKNGQIWVSQQFLKSGQPVGDEKREEDMILVDAFEVAPAQTTAKLGMTVNLGNYESLRVDVGVSVPCYKEEIPAATQFCFDFAEKKLFEKVAEVKKAL